MSIFFVAKNPEALLQNFKDLIEQTEQEGKIKTWEQHNGGFRHTAPEVKSYGIFEPHFGTEKNGQKWLRFDLKLSKIKHNDPEYAYAYFHGHLLQAFIVHLNKEFDWATFVDKRGKNKKPA